ncbi:MAG: hypothetical protein H6R18_585 [Proteobacteria bacterium]|nr:hypothetical protein [Pseudomonadota bacterium]
MYLMRTITTKVICLGLLVSGIGLPHVFAAEDKPAASTSKPQPSVAKPLKWGDFGQERASLEARNMAAWVSEAGDNQNMPFVIIDKTDAKVFVFHPDGRLHGAAPALLGLALGDVSVPGIGNRKLASIRPEERTTPAGRFLASLGRNAGGKEILWVDYEGALSLHPVVTSNPKEQRAQRLATATPLDNRISYGCINVPAPFFKNVVSKTFKTTNGIVYILPETRSTSIQASSGLADH